LFEKPWRISSAVLPLLIVFLCASQYFMSGLTADAIKE